MSREEVELRVQLQAGNEVGASVIQEAITAERERIATFLEDYFRRIVEVKDHRYVIMQIRTGDMPR